jgi:putative transposase
MAATISQEMDRWFISFQVETEVKPHHGSEIIGVDLGVKDAVVLSDGSKFAGPRPLKRRMRTLKKRQRKHSRKVKGSNNRKKSAMRLARLHRKIKNQRKDFLHKVSSYIVSKAKTVVIEDLNVRGMLKNHKLARAISDIGFYEFRRQLEYKCKMNEVDLIIANRWFPSTQLCRFCGSLNKMPLSERVYKCDCGHTEDRDVNAAQNLRTLGFRGNYACEQKGSGHQFLVGDETSLDEAGTRSLATSISCYI